MNFSLCVSLHILLCIQVGDEGAAGVHIGHFHIPAELVVRGGETQSICQLALHMSQRSILCSSKGL